ncbi:hypothetical protein GKZ90_0021155 [Flavobacterium sp. MC2016-06]|uniref:hypothetical protein n=1 Tax=Flavobacterium sp. MC2016-06 TaxID=2676308 RepID=UPI0012BA65B5|nr:hypothetical protein [Flavobacterium sp. MC2016-06]MBU3861010.1 hypothetical protein [Flavobacterium sp. MC2016-06]
MTQADKITTLKTAIQNLKDYIQNADHSQPVSQQFIIDNLVLSGGEKEEYLKEITNRMDSFQLLDYGSAEVLSKEKLYLMLEEFENLLELIEL